MDVFVKTLEYEVGDTVRLGLFSDLHYFAHDQDEEALKRDLDKAAGLGARMSFGGDLVDLILPGDRKRYYPGVMKQLKREWEDDGTEQPERQDLMNAQVEYLFEALRPYNELIDLIGAGNHETAALKYHNFDVLKSVAALLNRERRKGQPPVFVGDYRGFMRYKLVWKGAENTRYLGTKQFDILRHHGKGGGAYVTKGIIDLQRLRGTFTADLYWTGHKHKGVHDPGMVEVKLGQTGKLIRRRQEGIQTPGYKGLLRDTKGRAVHQSYEDQFYDVQSIGWGLVTLGPLNRGSEPMKWNVELEVNH